MLHQSEGRRRGGAGRLPAGHDLQGRRIPGERGKYAPTGDELREFDGSIFDHMLEGYDDGVLIEADGVLIEAEGRGDIVKIYLWGDGTLVGDQVAEFAARAPVEDALKAAVEKAVAPAQIEWPPETT